MLVIAPLSRKEDSMNQRRTVVVPLFAIAVLLTLNVIIMGSRSAEARPGGGVRAGDGDPYVAKRLASSQNAYYRVWSDGQVDYINRAEDTCDWIFWAIIVEPVAHPAPVVDANLAAGERGFIMEFDDGRVDHVAYRDDFLRCIITGEGSDPFCMGDTDRSGVTDMADLLTVLSDWGECVE